MYAIRSYYEIVWAAEILLEMDIPEFRPENLSAKPDWHTVGPLADMAMKEITYRECDGRNLYIYRDSNILRVYDSRCPHQVTNIPHLTLEGSRLTCPKHKWAFDITSGECVEIGNRPLRSYNFV